MERAVGTTFEVDNDELIVKEVKGSVCIDENGEKCYFYEKCFKALQKQEDVGWCASGFRTDEKNVIFIKI